MEPQREATTVKTVSAFRVLIGTALLFLAGLGVGAVLAARDASPNPLAQETASASTPRVTRAALSTPATLQSVTDLSNARRTPTVVAAVRVSPSVVTIRTIQRVRRQPSIFDRFLGESSGVSQGLGSGFAIDDEGTILTNHHVVRGADQILAIDEEGQTYEAELIGSDELTDLAVLHIPAGRIPAAPLGTSSDLFVGEPAIAIGNPSGYSLANTEATVTSGVVSGVGRDIRSQSGQEVLYADMIQTDASINPGNSGGPLANAEGEIIGVNSSIFSRSGGSEGLGFAIPIDRALKVAGELLEFGRVRRPWAGLDVITDRNDTESFFGRPVVEQVYPATPAEAAGLRPGDEIVALNDRRVHHDLDWQVGLVEAGVGSVIDVLYRRNGQEAHAELRLEEIPSGRAERVEVLSGLGLVTVTPEIVAERGLGIEFGALIVSIDEDVARVTRLRAGDVIWGINGNEVRTAEDAGELFDSYARSRETRGWVRVHITRGRQSGALQFRVG